MNLLVLAFLTGCGNNKSGEVFSAENAPWSMDGANVFLFTKSDANNGREGTGVLAISTESVTACKDVRAGVPSFGSGLWFEVRYFTGRAIGSAAPAWDGLYVTGDATATDSPASRSLTVAGWHEGFSYTFSGPDAWMEVKHGAQDRFAGEFSTQWWSGKFDAQVCEGAGTGNGPDNGDDGDTGDTGS
jgi:hypothetical protein